jgi:hypothetical protein
MNLHPDFTEMIVAALPTEIRELAISEGPNILIAGGFCRDVMTGAEPKDIDIFSVSSQAMHNAIHNFDWTEHYTARLTANAKSFIHDDDGPDVQFISRVYYADHFEAVKSFDFSICQVGVFYIPGKGWEGICTVEYMEDLPEFKMRYTAPERDEDPGASLLRMVKFVSRGYKIAEADIARVMGRFVVKLDEEPRSVPETEESATERVKAAFRRIGYAGKQEIVVSDDVPF